MMTSRSNMKLTCDFKAFRTALATAARACSKENTKPILQSVLVETFASGGNIIGTNNEIGIEIDFACQSSEKGKFLLPASKTLTCIGAVSRPVGDLKIEVKPTVIVLTYLQDGRSWKLPVQNADEHPGFDVEADGDSVTVPGDKLAMALSRAMTSTNEELSSESTTLKGIQCDCDGETLEFTSADGRRVSNQSLSVDDASPFESRSRIISPVLARLVINSVADKGNAKVTFTKNCNRMAVSCDGLVIAGAMIAGNFPDWRPYAYAVRPTSKILVSAPDLLERIAGYDAVNAEGMKRLRVIVSDGKLTLLCPHSQAGAGDSEIPVNYKGEPFTVALSGKFLAQALAALGDRHVEFGFSDDTNPVFLECDDFTYIQMLMENESEVTV